jgi:chromosome partitioning protein
MLTVAVIAQRGGVGKTTLALHLAVEAAKAEPAVIVDIDPQSSAAQRRRR